MGIYDEYAKHVLTISFGSRFDTTNNVLFSFGEDGGTGAVDGTIDDRVAVEIGVGSPKQIRGGLLDLLWHSYPVKLLLLVDTPGHSTQRSVGQAGAILAETSSPGVIIRLSGNSTADKTHVESDQRKVSEVVGGHLSGAEQNLIRIVDMVEESDTTLSIDEAGLPFRWANHKPTRDQADEGSMPTLGIALEEL